MLIEVGAAAGNGKGKIFQKFLENEKLMSSSLAHAHADLSLFSFFPSSFSPPLPLSLTALRSLLLLHQLTSPYLQLTSLLLLDS